MSSRVALVTGGSRGIGRAISLSLAAAGHRVAVNYRADVEAAKEVATTIEAAGGEVLLVQGDVSKTADVEAMFDEVEGSFGEVSILVNNAGIRVDGLAIRMSDEAWDKVISTNLFGPFACSRRALLPMLRARWGRIINIASVVGLKGNPGQANYAAAKAGLIGLTRTLAIEVGAKGITVNAVAPGLVDTDLTGDMADSSVLLSQVPAGKAATPENIAPLALFLASEEAGYINGAVVTADGGMTA
ncbi:MAG: 3-oxoacyl-ACP reductase FabG [Actinobacteria bacterium]|nr:3-oxoacyl-ACP reductase FabG [Actinomycetota bacterium]